MMRTGQARSRLVMVAALIVLAACAGPTPADRAAPQPARSTHYEDLLSLFAEWRTFQRPALVNGVPDYTVAAMATQHKALSAYQSRLAGIDPKGWPIPQQADYHVVGAEMHGLDFDHRVLRPWAENPAFYATIFPSESDQPAREGPFAYGAVELWSYRFPLSSSDAAAIASGVRAVPGLLAQARTNLVGNGKDLWVHGARDLRQQSTDLQSLATRLTLSEAALAQDVERARIATDEFAAWLDREAASKTGPSGVGVENYDWYLRHVMLLPYTWRDLVTLMERELARAHTSLALEETRNAALPPQAPIASAEKHTRRFGDAVSEYIAFLVGKIEIEKLLADRKRQLADRFTMMQFVDELDAAGQIPISLLRWELTGELAPETARLLSSAVDASPPRKP